MKIVALSLALTFLGDHLPPDQVKEGLCLTEIVHYESNGEGIEGKKATANVALTRVETDRFPDDLCSVLKAPHAFSHRGQGKDLSDVVIRQPADRKSFKETLTLVVKALTTGIKDNTQGADHFFNPQIVYPAWAKEARSVVQIGNHVYVNLYGQT